jgi:hypothetical protein
MLCHEVCSQPGHVSIGLVCEKRLNPHTHTDRHLTFVSWTLDDCCIICHFIDSVASLAPEHLIVDATMAANSYKMRL